MALLPHAPVSGASPTQEARSQRSGGIAPYVVTLQQGWRHLHRQTAACVRRMNNLHRNGAHPLFTGSSYVFCVSMVMLYE